jgi:hypothetical protein
MNPETRHEIERWRRSNARWRLLFHVVAWIYSVGACVGLFIGDTRAAFAYGFCALVFYTLYRNSPR